MSQRLRSARQPAFVGRPQPGVPAARVALLAAVAATMLAIAGPASAQFKWQTPDGRTVYGDMPPATGVAHVERMGRGGSATADEPERVALPFALRSAAERFPVTLYVAAECQPCAQGRAHLQQRGIPFAEKSVSTSADFDAFKALGFASNSFPALAVGRDRTVGFEAGAWDRSLTAAGYPTASQLPSGYRQARAEPLTAPPSQQLNVNVRRETAATEAGGNAPSAGTAGSGNTQRAIDQYRANLQAAERARTQQEQPAVRF